MADQFTVTIKLNADTGQFTTDVNKADKALEDLGDNGGKKAKDGMGGLQKAITGAGLALAGMAILDKVGELNALGQQANNTDRTFMQLVGNQENYNKTLGAMREVTHGVVADMQLQQIANSMLVTGLAKNAEEVAGLTNLGVNLSVALGQDATEGAQNFVAAINNMSFERLDTLGISASNVRERMAELKQEGYDTQEAFKMATLEEGEKTLNRLGDTIEQNVSSLDKLKTRVENIVQDIGQGVSTVVNQAATTADQAIQIVQILTNSHPEQAAQQQAATDAANGFINAYFDVFEDALTAQDVNINELSAQTANGMLEALDAAVRMVQADPTLLDNMGKLAGNILASGFVGDNQRLAEQLANATYEMFESDAVTQASEQAAVANAAAYSNAYQSAMLGQAASMKAAMPATDPLGAARRWFSGGGNASFTDRLQVIKDAREERELINAQNAARREAQAIMEDLAATQDRLGQLNTSGFMSAEQVSPFVDALEKANAEVERMEELAETKMVSEAVVDRAKATRDAIQEAADAAEEMGRNLEDASIGQLLGQGGGGRQGELTDMLMGLLGDQGLGDDQLGNIQRTLDLASGRQTDASVVMEDQVMPMIAELAKADPESAATAIANVNRFLELANTMGMSPGQVATGLPGATGFGYTMGGGGQEITIAPGDTPSSIAAKYGISVDQAKTLGGSSFLPGSYTLGAGGVAPMPGFSPDSFFNSMMTGGFPQPAPGLNPLDIYGSIGLTAPEGESPVSNIADDFHEAQDSIADIMSSFTDINSEADVLVGKMDEVAKPRDVTFNVKLSGDQAVISLLTNGQTALNLGGGGGSSPVVPGDPRVGGRPQGGNR